MKRVIGIILLVFVLVSCDNQEKNIVVDNNEEKITYENNISNNSKLTLVEENNNINEEISSRIVEEHEASPENVEKDTLKEYSFDGCGNTKKYEGKEWYSDLMKTLTNLAMYPHSQPAPYINGEGEKVRPEDKIKIDNISEICYSENGNMVILSIRGEYGGGGSHIYKYSILTKSLEEANRITTEEHWFCPPYIFGKRTGNKILMSCFAGDAGEAGVTYYQFNFVENSVKALKYCPTVSNGSIVIENQIQGQEKSCTPRK